VQLVFYPRTDQPVACDWLDTQLRAAEVTGKVWEAPLTDIMATVAAGLAVSVQITSQGSLLRPPGVRFIPLEGPTVDLVMSWGPGPQSAAVRAFRDELRKATPAYAPRPGS
jgi:DNA-binding transcriptional LysR family regulator